MANLEELNENTFSAAVLNSSGLVLIDFWAPWCGPCRKMAPVLEQIQNEMSDSIKIAKVDTDKYPNLASEYGVFSLPSLLLFKDGEVKEVMVGLMPKSAVVNNIKKYLS